MPLKETCNNCKSQFTNETNKLFHLEFCQYTNTPTDITKTDYFIKSVYRLNQIIQNIQNETNNITNETQLKNFKSKKNIAVTIISTLIYQNINNYNNSISTITNLQFKILQAVYDTNNEDTFSELFEIFTLFCGCCVELEYQKNISLFYNVFNKYTKSNCSDKNIFIRTI